MNSKPLAPPIPLKGESNVKTLGVRCGLDSQSSWSEPVLVATATAAAQRHAVSSHSRVRAGPEALFSASPFRFFILFDKSL